MRRRYSTGFITVVHGSTILNIFLAVFFLLLFVFSVSAIMTSLKPEYRLSSQSVHTVTNQFTGKMLFALLANENQYFFSALPNGKELPNLSNELFKLSTNISLDDPRSLLGRELPGFFIFDNEILVAGKGTDYTNMPFESSPPIEVLKEAKDPALQNVDKIEDPTTGKKEMPNQTTNGQRVVEVYHTHNRESFLPYLKGITDPDLAFHSQINITKLGQRLQNDLEDKGIGVSFDDSDIMTILNRKGLPYTMSYQESRKEVETAMAQNKHLAYFIDIHRDSRRKKDTTITINGKTYGKIAFIIGRNNPNYEKNAAFADKLHRALEKKYPGISRGVMKQGGAGHNGVYNQDLSSNALLIEVGGVDNTFEEMYLTIDAFADVFSEFYWDAKAVDQIRGNSEAK